MVIFVKKQKKSISSFKKEKKYKCFIIFIKEKRVQLSTFKKEKNINKFKKLINLNNLNFSIYKPFKLKQVTFLHILPLKLISHLF